MLRAVRLRRGYWPEHGLFSGLRNVRSLIIVTGWQCVWRPQRSALSTRIHVSSLLYRTQSCQLTKRVICSSSRHRIRARKDVCVRLSSTAEVSVLHTRALLPGLLRLLRFIPPHVVVAHGAAEEFHFCLTLTVHRSTMIVRQDMCRSTCILGMQCPRSVREVRAFGA